jgi:hypothetical protein
MLVDNASTDAGSRSLKNACCVCGDAGATAWPVARGLYLVASATADNHSLCF